MERYGELAANQIKPHLGAHKLQRLKPEHVQQWHGALLASGLTARTTKHAHKLLHRVLADAVLNGTVSRNVAAIHKPPAVEEAEIEILSPEQIADAMGKLEDHALFPIVATALYSGLRRGELLALTWGSIDLDAATLRVVASVEETKSGLRVKPSATLSCRPRLSPCCALTRQSRCASGSHSAWVSRNLKPSCLVT
jgi:integrase